MSSVDYYEFFEISPNASPSDIQIAYRKKAKEYHPDVRRTISADRWMKLVNHINVTLSDPIKRAAYNRNRLSNLRESSRIHSYDTTFRNRNEERDFKKKVDSVDNVQENHYRNIWEFINKKKKQRQIIEYLSYVSVNFVLCFIVVRDIAFTLLIINLVLGLILLILNYLTEP